MNKITFLSFGYWQSVCIAVLLSIAATVMLASCSDDDTSGGTAPDDGNAIRFTTAIASFTGSDAVENPGRTRHYQRRGWYGQLLQRRRNDDYGIRL